MSLPKFLAIAKSGKTPAITPPPSPDKLHEYLLKHMEIMMRILSAKQVADITSLSIPQIRRMANQGKLPSPVRISGSRVGWIEDDLAKWLETISKKQIEDDRDVS